MAAVLFYTALGILAAPSFFDPEFKVVNNSSETVSIVAEWRSNEKQISSIESMSSYQFSVNGEDVMRFRVRYASGKELETDPLYFSSGIKVIAIITSDGIEVRYDNEA
ncbi:MAG: hypothetical protein V7752_06580 [Halopseudomonas sp.]